MKKAILFVALQLSMLLILADDGYRLWLRYDKISDPQLLRSYNNLIENVTIYGSSATYDIIRTELQNGLSGMLHNNKKFNSTSLKNASIIGLTTNSLAYNHQFKNYLSPTSITGDGYAIFNANILGKNRIVITANTEIGLLYGTFRFLQLLQTHNPLNNIRVISSPLLQLRMLNHWDNLDRHVERGYAGISLWNWHTLPDFIDKRYIDYARANASIGINAVTLTNVNANATVLTRPYLEKVKALAAIFRPYGIKVFLTARFSAPVEIGGLTTADPLQPNVQNWWNEKVKEIYDLIPDFGGFVVKANSEGQPGPQNYNRTHADGANMMADAVAPFNGIIMWRAFVYSNENPEDRHKQAYNEFVPLDGKFRKNVMLQVKNGAIDFMPREPFHPLFGAMPKTPLMMEFQVTQEYTGQATNLVFLAPLYKEVLEADTYAKGKGSTVAKVIDGSMYPNALTGMTGVANIGNDINWCGHPFAQANWYALGKLAWNYNITSQQIAEDWLRMTFSNDAKFVSTASKMMLESRDIMVQYSNPLGLHHIMGTGHHYGPAPWVSNLSRPEWNPVYYHKADSIGLGFDRTITGTNAIAQYNIDAAKHWINKNTCDENFLLWFHHIGWQQPLKSGKSLWNELCFQYYTGAERVKQMQQTWASLQKYTDTERFNQVTMLLKIQHKEAVWWRNACLRYFQQFSKSPIPSNYQQPDKDLEYYQKLSFPFAPGN